MGFFDAGSQTVRGNENLTLPKFLELRDLSESIFGFFLRHFEIRKPEKCGGVGTITSFGRSFGWSRGALNVCRTHCRSSRAEPGHRCAHIDDLALRPPHANRALNATLVWPRHRLSTWRSRGLIKTYPTTKSSFVYRIPLHLSIAYRYGNTCISSLYMHVLIIWIYRLLQPTQI